MSPSTLLAYVAAVIAVQIAISLAVFLRRRRRTAAAAPVAPLVVPPTSGAWPGWRAFRVVRRDDEDRAHTLCSFQLAPVDGARLPAFVPGQYLTFAVPIGGGETRTRCYSLSDRPDPISYRISVKRVLAPAGRPDLPCGQCSNALHDRLQVGDVIEVKAPAGRFVVDTEPGVPVVLIAGGIGITPLLSMLRSGLAAEPNRSVHLYYGVRQGAELGFSAELEALVQAYPSFHLNVVYSQPAPDDLAAHPSHRVGHVDLDLLRRTLPAGRHAFYVCGPPAMLASLLPALRQWGVRADDLHSETFGPESVRSAVPAALSAARQDAASLEVTFVRSGRTLEWDGRDPNLLEFAERNGVQVASGCRSGSCGACEVRLVRGTVRYAERPDHEIAPGHCLLCVGAPESLLEIEA